MNFTRFQTVPKEWYISGAEIISQDNDNVWLLRVVKFIVNVGCVDGGTCFSLLCEYGTRCDGNQCQHSKQPTLNMHVEMVVDRSVSVVFNYYKYLTNVQIEYVMLKT